MTDTLDFVTLDVFTTQRFAGNPLAIVLVPTGQDVATSQMQLIAREFNFSETVFFYEEAQKEGLEWRFRIFTTKLELTFAGHPTIGTASYLLSKLRSNKDVKSVRLLCQAGPIECRSGATSDVQSLPGAGDTVTVEVPHDFLIHSTTITKTQVLHLQPGLNEKSIVRADLVSPVKGMTFLVVELVDTQALDSVEPTGIEPVFKLDQGWDFGFLGTAFYLKTSRTTGEGGVSSRYNTRMIETQMEDPATGSMSCGLAALLAIRDRSRVSDFVFTQGSKMGRESHIGVQVILDERLQRIKTLAMRGNAINVATGTIKTNTTTIQV